MDAQGLKAKRGRPPSPTGAKRKSFNTRIRDALKAELDAEATAAGRSLSEEIELRLERSFLPERTFDERLIDMYGRQGAALMHMLGRLVRGAPTAASALEDEWLEEPFSCAHAAALLGSFAKWLCRINPIGSSIHPLNHDLDEKAIQRDAEQRIRTTVRTLIEDRSADGWFAKRRKEFGEATMARIKAAGGMQ